MQILSPLASKRNIFIYFFFFSKDCLQYKFISPSNYFLAYQYNIPGSCKIILLLTRTGEISPPLNLKLIIKTSLILLVHQKPNQNKTFLLTSQSGWINKYDTAGLVIRSQRLDKNLEFWTIPIITRSQTVLLNSSSSLVRETRMEALQ